NAKSEDRATPLQRVWLQQRRELAARFRQKYESDVNGDPNVEPYFIGIFDTVASLANPVVSTIFISGLAAILAAVAWLISWYFGISIVWSIGLLFGAGVLVGLVTLARTHVKRAFGLESGKFWHLKGYPLWQLVHITDMRMKFYDRAISTNVDYMRHAISIDES